MSTKTGRGSVTNADFLSGGNRAYLEDLHSRYRNNPDSVDPSWQQVFHNLANEPTTNSAATTTDLQATDQAEYGRKQAAVLRLINAYRTRGHSIATTDPLGLARPEVPEDFDLKAQGLEKADLSTSFDTGSLAFGPVQMPLSRILELCDATYCGPLGIEYMYITDTAQKRWLQERLECEPVRASMNADFRRHLLQRLTAAEGLERYLHTRYVGQKRFSLEGGEALVPMLGDLIQR
ncbi:MAG: 2-oxoglutarate dehydrogenase E1 component, partial [Arenicellales bacterium]